MIFSIGPYLRQMQMKILIADDEPLARMRIRALLNEIGGYDILEAEASNGRETLKLIDSCRPDLVLLDIGMPGMSGMEAAQHITKLPVRPTIIFTTAYGDYALEAFEQQAVDYLLKPIRKDRLQLALEKAGRLHQTPISTSHIHSSHHPKQTHNENATDAASVRTHISVISQGMTQLVPVDRIYYFQADQKYVSLRWQDGQVLIDESLKNLEEEFSGQFLRIHRNALVALVYISSLTKDKSNHHFINFENVSEKLEISRRHLKIVKNTLRDMAGGR